MGEYNDLTKKITKIKAPEPDKPKYQNCSVNGCGNFADIITDKVCVCGQHYQLEVDRRGRSAHILSVKRSGDPEKLEAMRYLYKQFQPQPIWDNTKYHRMKKRDFS